MPYLDGPTLTAMLLCTLFVFGSTLLVDIRAWIKNGRAGPAFSAQKYGAVAACVLVAVAATMAGKAQKHVGAPIISLVLGILLVNLLPARTMPESFRKHASAAGKKCLNFGIIALGATLSVSGIFGAAYALPLILFNTCLSFAIAYLVGLKVLKQSPNTCTLVGGGTSICGGTAIAALSPVIKAKEEETAYAMAAIFLFDLLACLAYPYLAVGMGLSETQFGFLAGTAINDTSSVVAAQETYAGLIGAEQYAMPATIKVVRTTMIIVLVLVFSIITIRRDTRGGDGAAPAESLGRTVWKAFPKFILWFVGAVLLNTVLSWYVADTAFYTLLFKPFFSNGYKFFVTIALAGIGFKIRFRDILEKGLRPVLLGGCTWLGLFLSSLCYVLLFL